MRHLKRLVIISLVLLLSTISLACQVGPTPKEKKTAKEIEVTEDEFKITPDRITVKKGETVTFKVKNDGTLFHTFTLEDLNKEVQVDSGDTEELNVAFDQTGTFKFICTVNAHAEKGMTGEVVVE